MQDENFQPTLKVREVLALYAHLTLPAAWSSARKAERSKEVIAKLGLGGKEGTLVSCDIPVSHI